ncbi:MAG: polyphosphate kinase 1 [Candidatus Kapabacteria bacterium]|nr:polyphosphate kinase 1 [Candidatus Kapabacteria bacterium]
MKKSSPQRRSSAKRAGVSTATSKGVTTAVDLDDESLYLNRELSWIEFNKRVLEEAEDPTHPLLERLKFLSIFSTNLDEFFMIRVAGLQEQITSGVTELSEDGMTPPDQIKEIRSRLLPLYKRHSMIWRTQVRPSLAKEGIIIHDINELTADEQVEVEQDFIDNIMPVLTPLALDPGHPFPRLLNRSLTVAFVLYDEIAADDESRVAVVQLPSALPRLIKLQRSSGHHYVLFEDIIRAHAGLLFPGHRIAESHIFRVTRDADVEIAEDEANDLMTAVAEGIRQRRWGTDAVRMEVASDMPKGLIQFFTRALELDASDVYHVDVPLNLQDFMVLLQLDKRKLKDAPFNSSVLTEFDAEGQNIFDTLKERDVLVHHPFDSFSNSVVKFIEAAADDPDVLAIKITLYRAGGRSPVIDALRRAASLGKNVTAFVELKARFDEETNIAWAKTLEQAGVHVVYGVMGLKVHCKVCLVIRKEGRNVLTYAHVATGNYNLSTSRVYTDVGIFTGRQEFERDFVHLFNLLTGYSRHAQWQFLGVAPLNLRETFIGHIEREIEHQQAGRQGYIIAKMNALIDAKIIKALYRASMAGVKIDLIVRGVCCLRPGIPGISENIVVRSILDRFLEHSRIFWFRNGGEETVVISSADWMPRNMERRVEIAFPVLDRRARKKLRDILAQYLADNVKARLLQSDGSYVRVESGSTSLRVQADMLAQLKRR